MLCKNPYYRDTQGRILRAAVGQIGDARKDMILSGVPFPCGQCLPCRINKRRVWTHRMMLEGYKHDASAFITLTYSDENLPYVETSDGCIPTLCKRDVQLFLKRLRKRIVHHFSDIGRFRYYMCGEYGPQTNRPHYHGILFGVDAGCADWINRDWSLGMTSVFPATTETMQYVAGYVTKKVVKVRTKKDARVPEFSLMSRKPGIGMLAIPELVRLMKTNEQIQAAIQRDGDIPVGLRHGSRIMPFGRFLAMKLREALNISPEAGFDRFFHEMLAKHIEFSHFGKGIIRGLLDESAQRNRQIEAKHKIQTRGSL